MNRAIAETFGTPDTNPNFWRDVSRKRSHNLLSNRANTACFSGHRPEKLGVNVNRYVPILNMALSTYWYSVYTAAQDGYRIFITGMARGFDIWGAKIVTEIRQLYFPDIKLVLAIPFVQDYEMRTGEDLWDYNNIILQADDIVILSDHYYPDCYKIRNAFMVNHSSRLIAALLYDRSGTGQTVRFAQRSGLDVRIVRLGPLVAVAKDMQDQHNDKLKSFSGNETGRIGSGETSQAHLSEVQASHGETSGGICTTKLLRNGTQTNNSSASCEQISGPDTNSVQVYNRQIPNRTQIDSANHNSWQDNSTVSGILQESVDKPDNTQISNLWSNLISGDSYDGSSHDNAFAGNTPQPYDYDVKEDDPVFGDSSNSNSNFLQRRFIDRQINRIKAEIMQKIVIKPWPNKSAYSRSTQNCSELPSPFEPSKSGVESRLIDRAYYEIFEKLVHSNVTDNPADSASADKPAIEPSCTGDNICSAKNPD